MTGKEALEEIRLVRVYVDEFGCAIPLKKVKEYKIIEKDLDELTKYKRAFEILKDKGVCVRNDRLYFDYEIYIKSTKEERELLEELIRDE